MGKTSTPPLTSALEILLTKARSYATRKYYLSLTVFSKHRSEMVLLTKQYGGAYYIHQTGFIWSVGNLEVLRKIVKSIPKDKLPSVHHFEDKIQKA